MRKNVNRSPTKSKKIYFKKGKNIITKNINTFKKEYKVRRVIRLLPADFKLVKKNMKQFMHFSIQKTAHKSGDHCLIVKIYKRGYFSGKIYKQPIFYSNNFILAKCLAVKNNVHYYDLKKRDFVNSLSNIKNFKSLKEAILRRYKKSLFHISDSKKISLGIATTKLKIIKRFSTR